MKKVIFAIGIILSLNDATEGMRQRSATWSTGTQLKKSPILSEVPSQQSDEFPEHTANYQGEDDPNELIQKIHRVASKIEKTQCMRDLEPLIDLIQDLRSPLYKFEKGIRRINRHDPDTRDYILFPVMDKLLRQEFVQSLAYTDTSFRKVRKRAFSVSEKELLHPLYTTHQFTLIKRNLLTLLKSLIDSPTSSPSLDDIDTSYFKSPVPPKKCIRDIFNSDVNIGIDLFKSITSSDPKFIPSTPIYAKRRPADTCFRLTKSLLPYLTVTADEISDSLGSLRSEYRLLLNEVRKVPKLIEKMKKIKIPLEEVITATRELIEIQSQTTIKCRLLEDRIWVLSQTCPPSVDFGWLQHQLKRIREKINPGGEAMPLNHDKSLDEIMSI